MNTSMNVPKQKHHTPVPAMYPPPPEPDPDPNIYNPNNLERDNEILNSIIKMFKQTYSIPSFLIDEQKNLIVKSQKLKQIIAILCNTTQENVIINTKNNLNINCCDCCRLLNTVTIEDIYIKNGDQYKSFHIYYNEEYNRILEEFGISLLKVFDGYDITEMVDGDYEM